MAVLDKRWPYSQDSQDDYYKYLCKHVIFMVIEFALKPLQPCNLVFSLVHNTTPDVFGRRVTSVKQTGRHRSGVTDDWYVYPTRDRLPVYRPTHRRQRVRR
ncbi:Replication factor C subunit 1 [Fusarium oxysporum f. sp. albedinis]|nr:Replication factor C subunit 1 [Fusarium oxysporum f. sp. albedinis]